MNLLLECLSSPELREGSRGIIDDDAAASRGAKTGAGGRPEGAARREAAAGAGGGGAGGGAGGVDAGGGGRHAVQRAADAVRGGQPAGEDQAPQVGDGDAVHLQVRRHLHPRRRRLPRRRRPVQRQEASRRVQGRFPQPAVLPGGVLGHLQPHQGWRRWPVTTLSSAQLSSAQLHMHMHGIKNSKLVIISTTYIHTRAIYQHLEILNRRMQQAPVSNI